MRPEVSSEELGNRCRTWNVYHGPCVTGLHPRVVLLGDGINCKGWAGGQLWVTEEQGFFSLWVLTMRRVGLLHRGSYHGMWHQPRQPEA